MKDCELWELYLSARPLNALAKAGINTVRQIASLSDRELLELDGFGRKSLKEVREVMDDLSLSRAIKDGRLDEWIHNMVRDYY